LPGNDARRRRIGASREAGLFAADTDRKIAGLDDAPAVVQKDRHLARRQAKRDRAFLARLQVNSFDAGAIPGAPFCICKIFSSKVIRDTRSATRFSVGRFGFL